MSKNWNSRNIIKTALLVLFASGIIGVFAYILFSEDSSATSYEVLTVTDLDVGKADAAVLRYKDFLGIIDTGTEESYPVIDAFLKKEGIDNIDWMLITHYDKDHSGGALSLIDDYDVDKICLPGYVSEKKHYGELTEKARTLDTVTFVSSPEEYSYGELKLQIIPPADPEGLKQDEEDYDNNMSLLCMVTLGSKKLFFTGDIEKDRIAQVLNSPLDIDADWIKLPHHGTHEKKMKKFLKRVSPEYSVISTSEEEPPEEELLALLNELGIKNYDTVKENVVTECDGHYIKVTGSSAYHIP